MQILDTTKVKIWKSEALAASRIPDERGETTDLTVDMFEYCMDELRYKAKLFKQTGFVTAYDGDVVKSDSTVSNELRLALRSATAPLEHAPPTCRDWHPGSDEMVLDLVDPSLFPVVYGVTRVLKDPIVGLDNCIELCGEGATHKPKDLMPKPSGRLTERFSRRFQWLPCQVKFAGNDGEVR